MAKKTSKKEAALAPVEIKKHFLFTGFRVQSLILILLGFLFYANSFKNEYAFDDNVVILKNEYVQEGLSGIPKILSTDSYDSFYKQSNAVQQLSGGRYRPLSIITFAIEQQLFGSKAKNKPEDDIAALRHAVNVFLYIFSVVLMLYFLRNFVFKKNPLIAFIAALLFLIHPLHTEVVANIKSRDEIMSFLFIMLTFIFVFRYREGRRRADLLPGLIFYFLALLSKEYALTLVVLLPVLLYIVKSDTLKESISSTWPYFLIVAVYLGIRFSVIGVGNMHENQDVLNNPFKFATTPEKWATKIEILIFYLRLLLYPNPLSYDYSYNTISYVNFGNGIVWLSFLIHIFMIVAMLKLFFKRNILSFAIAFYLLHLMLVSNLILDVGATMGERLVYHSSFGFVIIIAIGITRLLEIIKQPPMRKIVPVVLCSFITCWSWAKVVERNQDWKNDATLYIKDVQKVPNSSLANGNAGVTYYDMSLKPENKNDEKELLEKALYHLNKAVSIHKSYAGAYLNLGNVYLKLKEYDKAKENWDMAKSIYPDIPLLMRDYAALSNNEGNSKNDLNDFKGAIEDYTEAIKIDPKYSEAYYNRGNAKDKLQDYTGAIADYTSAIELDADPVYADVYCNIGVVKCKMRDFKGGIEDLSKAIAHYPDDEKAYLNRAKAKGILNDNSGAMADYSKAIELNPNDAEAYFNRGIVRIKLNDKAGGCSDLSKAKESGLAEADAAIKDMCK